MSKVRPEIEERINQTHYEYIKKYKNLLSEYHEDEAKINKDKLNEITKKENQLLGKINNNNNNNNNNISNNLIKKRLSQYKIEREISDKIEKKYKEILNDRKNKYLDEVNDLKNNYSTKIDKIERDERRLHRQNNNLPVHTPKKIKKGGKKKTKRKSTAKKSPNKSKSKK
jgi:hypothetical protein